ncbi:hypothetical protein ILUMI_25589 [Ignelater luminosus]|uniref:lysozyme n=1 Tax=Ignelater luminosus TaxID=2038154 RepID=A0A8K0C9N8_IGNLU|nr:hypothetical protein ILUMI_25589 [Ignelater luminosus]
MKLFTIVFVIISLALGSNARELENLMGTPMQNCLNCLCHARSGCYSRFNCARYSISREYWEQAGSFSPDTSSNLDQAYRACMVNENCILNTLKTYTEQYGERDCNCDGIFDCKDRLAIHLFNDDCTNPKYGETYSRRFNDCAQQIGVTNMSPSEGSCDIPEVDPS